MTPPRRKHPLGLDLDPTRSADEVEDAATRIYLAALRHPSPNRAALVAQGIPMDLIDAVIPVLHQRGLVRVESSGHWNVLPPDVSLPALATEFERRARETRAAARELAQMYFAARSAAAPRDVSEIRMLTSLHEVHVASSDAMGAVKKRAVVMRALSPRTQQLLSAPLHAHEAPTVTADGQEVETLAVYDTSILQVEGALQILRARIRGGESARLIRGVPFSALVVDRSVAIMEVSNHEPSARASLLIQNAPLAEALGELVEEYWERGTPVPRLGEVPEGEATKSMDRRDRTILSLMAAGAADVTIARQCGISQRTVERRIRALMNSLGAGTRFQAGVQAVRHGLI